MILVTLRGLIYKDNVHIMKLKLFISTLCIMSIIGCQESEETKIKDCIMSFGKAFFNYNMKETLGLCTPESKKHIAYLSSIITEDDLSILKSNPEEAQIEIKNIQMSSGDTSCITTIEIDNWLSIYSIDNPGKFINRRTLTLKLVKRNGKWLVDFRKEDLPQNEKSNPD